jgi:hypothetical protein
LEKSAELGEDLLRDLVQMNGFGFSFHSATHERDVLASAWTLNELVVVPDGDFLRGIRDGLNEKNVTARRSMS